MKPQTPKLEELIKEFNRDQAKHIKTISIGQYIKKWYQFWK